MLFLVVCLLSSALQSVHLKICWLAIRGRAELQRACCCLSREGAKRCGLWAAVSRPSQLSPIPSTQACCCFVATCLVCWCQENQAEPSCTQSFSWACKMNVDFPSAAAAYRSRGPWRTCLDAGLCLYPWRRGRKELEAVCVGVDSRQVNWVFCKAFKMQRGFLSVTGVPFSAALSTS